MSAHSKIFCSSGLGGATIFRFLDFRFYWNLGQEKNRSSLRVSRVMLIHAFWQQSFPSALAPAGERGASAFGFHACAKAMLTFAGALGWLVRAFHKSER